MSGGFTIFFYSLEIFSKTDIALDKYGLSLLLNCGFSLGYVISVFAMPLIPRRVLFITSTICMAIFIALIGFSFKKDLIPQEYNGILLPISSTLTAILYGMGLGPVLASFLGEIFPQRIKSFAASFALSIRYFAVFILLKTFPNIMAMIGLDVLFWIHSFILLFTSILAYLIMPETQGKTLTELSELYGKGKNEQVKKYGTP